MSVNTIFIHTANIPGFNLRISQFIDTIVSSGLYDNINILYICYVGTNDMTIDEKYKNLHKINIINVSNNLLDYELPTLQYLYEYCLKYSNHNILYIHTKNIGKAINDCIEDQIKYMLYFLVNKWEDSVNLLTNGHNTCGVDLRDEPTLHYSGNFWWAKSDYIKTLPSPIEFGDLNKYPNKLNSIRHNQEFWLCYLKENHHSLWDCGISVYERHMHRYGTNNYIKNNIVKEEKNVVDIYLAHRNSNKFFEQQVNLIRKYFHVNEGSQLNIYGYVDGDNESIRNNLRSSWESLNVVPIFIPRIIQNYDRNYIGAGESFGLAFQYVYENYILKNNHISVCLENDVFPINHINIEEYIGNNEICGEIRFNAADLPYRMLMFWLGIIIFNGKTMQDRNLWRAESRPVKSVTSGRIHTIDCGGQSYYWIVKSPRNIKHIKTRGDEKYNPYTSLYCNPYNITTELELLPYELRENYKPHFRVLNYEDIFIHLERMGKENDNLKQKWWNNSYNKILKK